MTGPALSQIIRLPFVFSLLVTVTACGGGGGGSPPSAGVDGPALPACISNGSGTAILSWDPPVFNEDNSPVNLAGFKIYCETAGSGFQWVSVAGSSDTTIVINNLVAGVLTFAVTAVSVEGVEGAFSNAEAKTVF